MDRRAKEGGQGRLLSCYGERNNCRQRGTAGNKATRATRAPTKHSCTPEQQATPPASGRPAARPLLISTTTTTTSTHSYSSSLVLCSSYLDYSQSTPIIISIQPPLRTPPDSLDTVHLPPLADTFAASTAAYRPPTATTHYCPIPSVSLSHPIQRENPPTSPPVAHITFTSVQHPSPYDNLQLAHFRFPYPHTRRARFLCLQPTASTYHTFPPLVNATVHHSPA